MLNIDKHGAEIKLGDGDIGISVIDNRLCFQTKDGNKQVSIDFTSKQNIKSLQGLLHYMCEEYSNNESTI